MNSFGFSPVFCSSEDPSHPFENLFRGSANSGWISEETPNFPIEAIVDLKSLFVLTNLEVVSHESMICTRVDLFGTCDEHLSTSTEWFSIGYFGFSNNQRSQWIARELKRISIDYVKVRYLRFLIDDYHQTPHNREKRVSLVSLTLNGHPFVHMHMTNIDELEKDLKTAKNTAIEEENFADASLYKEELINIEENRSELIELFNKKAALLREEEYLKVDEIVQEINLILKNGKPKTEEPTKQQEKHKEKPKKKKEDKEIPQKEEENSEEKISEKPEEKNPEVNPEKEQSTDKPKKKKDKSRESSKESFTEKSKKKKEKSRESSKEDFTEKAKESSKEKSRESSKEDIHVEEGPRVEKPNIDETDEQSVVVGNDGFFLTGFEKDTVIHVANDSEPELKVEEEKSQIPPPLNMRQSIQKKPKVVKPVPKEKKAILPPKERVPKFAKEMPETPKKPEEPDPLSDENKIEGDTLINIFGEDVVAVAYSSNWSLRVNGIEKLCELIKSLKTKEERTHALSGLIPLLRRRFHDGLKATYVCAVEHTMDLIDSIEVENNTVATAVHVLLPIAISKIGDTNQRINEVSNNFAVWCTKKDKWAYNEVHSFAVKPPSNNQFHIQIAKLNLVSVLIEKYGISEKGKLKLNDVMNLVVPCLDSRKEEVRKIAIKLTISLQEKFGNSLDKYLRDVPRLVKDKLVAANQGKKN